MNQDLLTIPTTLIAYIRCLIDSAKSRIAHSIIYEMNLLYGYLGTRVKEKNFHNVRADYGNEFF